MPRDRAPNLTPARVEAIVRTVSRLPDGLTWETVVEAVRSALGCSYTRQTLHGHPAVLLAFQARKHGTPARPGERPLSARARREAELKADLRRRLDEALRREEALLERHMRFVYNASACGLSEAELDGPLPPTNRA